MTRHRPFASTLAAAAALGVVAGFISLPAAQAATGVVAAPCANIESVFARGSGQTVGAPGKEAAVFEASLKARILVPGAVHSYELGSEAIDGHQYPAVATADLTAPPNLPGSSVSVQPALDYTASVAAGVAELGAYVTARSAACPDAVFVIGGYSQGAQVAATAYNEVLTDLQRSTVVFNALFGDPNLNLPEGNGLFPAACTGNDNANSPWRRGVPECTTGTGSLGARTPYVPAAFPLNTGIWCNTSDFVCGSSKNLLQTVGHGLYGVPSSTQQSPIDAATQEVAARIATAQPSLAPFLDTATHNPAPIAGPNVQASGVDIAVVLDTSLAMEPNVVLAKDLAPFLGSQLSAMNGHIALVGYTDTATSSATVLSDFSTTADDVQAKLDAIVSAGTDTAPQGVVSALDTALTGLTWRPDATKAVIVLTDAALSPAVLPSLPALLAKVNFLGALGDYAKVSFYPVVPAAAAPSFGPVIAATQGQVFENNGPISLLPLSGALQAQVTAAMTPRPSAAAPVAILAHPSYSGPVGETITFNASQSYSPNTTLASFAWDFDGDGIIDASTPSPVTTHSYAAAFMGKATVSVVDANNVQTTTEAAVSIGTSLQPVLPSAAAQLAAVHSDTSASVSWAPTDATAAAWGITVDGALVGSYLASALPTAVLTGVPTDRDVLIGIAPVSATGFVGATVTTVLKAVPAVVDPPVVVPPVVVPGTPAVVIPKGSTEDKLAATGANNTAAWLGGGILLLALGSGALVFTRRRRQL